MLRRVLWGVSFVLLAIGLAHSQNKQPWAGPYETALREARAGNWVAAAQQFERAIELRAEETDRPSRITLAPGHFGSWRGGAPYTPHWGAGYAFYKAATEVSGEDRTQLLNSAVRHFGWFEAQGLQNPFVHYFHAEALALLGNTGGAEAARLRVVQARNIDVDLEFVTPPDKLAVNPARPVAEPGTTEDPSRPAIDPTVTPDRMPELPPNDPRAVEPDTTPTTADPQVSEPNVPEEQTERAVGQFAPRRPRNTDNADRNVDRPTQPDTPQPARPAGPAPRVVGQPRVVKPGEPEADGLTDLLNPGGGPRPVVIDVRPGELPPPSGVRPPTTTPTNPTVNRPVTTAPPTPQTNKYALLIGNTRYSLGVGEVLYASNSANTLAKALRDNAGYPEANVTVLLNASRDEILNTVTALANQIPENAVVTLFFAGHGRNNPDDGRDYLFGVDAEDLGEFGAAVSKDVILAPLVARAARVVTLWEVDRVAPNGFSRAFGAQVPTLPGSFAVWNGTAVNERCYAVEDANGQVVGLFANNLALALEAAPSAAPVLVELLPFVGPRVRAGSQSIARTVGDNSVTQTVPRPIVRNLPLEEAAL